MSNNFYNHGAVPATGASLSSATMRAEFDAIGAGFDKVSPLAGNADKVVVVNSSATAQTAITKSVLIDTTVVAATDKATPVDADVLPLVDSAASNALKKLTWANLKATITTYLSGVAFPIGATTPSTGAFTTLSAVTSTPNIINLSGATTGASYGRIFNTGSDLVWGTESSVGGVLMTGTSAYASVLYTNSAVPLQFGIAGVMKMSLAPTGLAVTGALSSTWNIGYATGAGGAVTQLTSRATGVTVNTPTGAITLFSAAGSASWGFFQVTNSTVAAGDTVIVSVKAAGASNAYVTAVYNVIAGSFSIAFQSISGAATDAPVFNFAVIKAVSA